MTQSVRSCSVWQFLMSGARLRKSSVTEIFLMFVRTKLPSVVSVIGTGSDQGLVKNVTEVPILIVFRYILNLSRS